MPSPAKQRKPKQDKEEEHAKGQLAETDRDDKEAKTKVLNCTLVVHNYDRGLGVTLLCMQVQNEEKKDRRCAICIAIFVALIAVIGVVSSPC